MPHGEETLSEAPSFREFRAMRNAAENFVDEDFQLECQFLLIVMGQLGLRPGEASHITRDWVDFDEEYIDVPGFDPCTQGNDGDICGYCRTRAQSAADHNDELTFEEAKQQRWEPLNPQSERRIPFDWLGDEKKIIEEYFEQNEHYSSSRASINRRIDRIAEATDILEKDNVNPKAMRGHAAINFANKGLGVIKIREYLGYDGYKIPIKILEEVSEAPEYDLTQDVTFEANGAEANKVPEKPETLEIGQIYRREAIHATFGGERFKGVSSATKDPYLFLFTGDGTKGNEYEATFTEDNLLKCKITQEKDHPGWTDSIRALSEHKDTGERVFAFESTRKPDFVNYLGRFEYESRFSEDLGKSDNVEEYIVVLSPVNETSTVTMRELDDLSESDLYEKALESVENHDERETVTVEQSRLTRSETVKQYALRKADGHCRGCGDEAPFQKKGGGPFLEVHHLHRQSDGGPDHPDNVIALCPNCHRKVHYGANGDEFNSQLIEMVESNST